MTAPVQPPLLHRVLVFSTKDGDVRYTLTNNDFLDFARAVEFEGPPKLGVAWTLIQRFAYLYPTYKTLSSFVTAYSQPINPRWFPKGKEHLAYLTMLQSQGDLNGAAREEKEALARIRKANVPLTSIHKDTLIAIDEVFTTHVSPIPKSLHFHAPDPARSQAIFAQNKGLDVVPYGTGIRENWFFGIQNHVVHVLAMLEDTGAIGSALIALGYSAAILYLAKRLCT